MLKFLSRIPERAVRRITKTPPAQYSNSKSEKKKNEKN